MYMLNNDDLYSPSPKINIEVGIIQSQGTHLLPFVYKRSRYHPPSALKVAVIKWQFRVISGSALRLQCESAPAGKEGRKQVWEEKTCTQTFGVSRLVLLSSALLS